MNARAMIFTSSLSGRRQNRARRLEHAPVIGWAIAVLLLVGLCAAQVTVMRVAGHAFDADTQTEITF